MKTLDIGFLEKIPLFTGLPKEKMEQVRSIMTIRTVTQGSFIIRENEQGSELFILLDGEVEVSRTLLLKISGAGMDQRDKMLNKLTANDHAFFGEMGLFDEKNERTASVIAKTHCSIAVLERDSFFQLTEQDKEIGYVILKNILRIVSDRLDKTTKDVLKLTTALSLALER
ncbi:MAG: cyclic nucleotide-binding domain-containing protein [Bacteriovoracaceae bacterium]|nr:cyclic nucleotide-binding domain-containing protein [Bacteroidota bacterium]